MKNLIKRIMAVGIIIAIFIAMGSAYASTETDEIVTVVSSGGGIVTVETVDGEIYTIEGDTHEVVMMGTFHKGELVYLAKVNGWVTAEEVVASINCDYIVKPDGKFEIISRTQPAEQWFGRTVCRVCECDDSPGTLCIIVE